MSSEDIGVKSELLTESSEGTSRSACLSAHPSIPLSFIYVYIICLYDILFPHFLSRLQISNGSPKVFADPQSSWGNGTHVSCLLDLRLQLRVPSLIAMLNFLQRKPKPWWCGTPPSWAPLHPSAPTLFIRKETLWGVDGSVLGDELDSDSEKEMNFLLRQLRIDEDFEIRLPLTHSHFPERSSLSVRIITSETLALMKRYFHFDNVAHD